MIKAEKPSGTPEQRRNEIDMMLGLAKMQGTALSPELQKEIDAFVEGKKTAEEVITLLKSKKKK